MLKFSTAIVSQPPVVLARVSMYVPAVLYGLPFQVYGSEFAQTVAFVVSLSSCVIFKFSTAIVSQPPVVPGSVSMYVPAVLYGLPFQVYGRAFAQTVAFVVFVRTCGMVKFSISMVSEPLDVQGRVSMYVPAVLYGLPFQVYGSEFAQTVAFVVSLSSCVIFKFSTAIVSQPPVVLLKVSV